MNWKEIESLEDLNQILESNNRVLLFKHSNRCSISSVALNRIERDSSNVTGSFPVCVLIDVVKDRDLSREIAGQLEVQHESPQIITFQSGSVDQVLNHFEITPSNLEYN